MYTPTLHPAKSLTFVGFGVDKANSFLIMGTQLEALELPHHFFIKSAL
jgi:hypothetical protein